jgi:CBS domain-containing protein
MKTITKPLVLRAETAAELMTPNPVSVSNEAHVSEAVVLLTERGFSAAPVIDEAGRPVGVVSRTDLLVHDREQCGLPPVPNDPAGQLDATRVRDVMTPVVFCVAPDDGADLVVKQLLGLNVHRLFVVDGDGVLVGVISTQDVLKFLRK